MTREHVLGSAEKAVLRALRQNGGTWTAEQRPLWDNRHWTRTILGRLANKGFVAEKVVDNHYELTDKGVLKADDIGFW